MLVQHGDRKCVTTSGVYFGHLKRFLLFPELAKIYVHTCLIILAVQIVKTQGQSLFLCT